MINKIKLTIAIPTFNGANRINSSINLLNKNKYLNNLNIKIIIIENPSSNTININEYKIYSNLEYIKNRDQIGLHGSWLKILEICKDETEWLMYLGDDDVININANTLLSFLSIAESNETNLVLSTEKVYSYGNKLIKKTKLVDKKKLNFSIIDYKKYISFAKLSDNFSFISSTIFKPNEDIFKRALENKKKIYETDCLHYLTLFPYAYFEDLKMMIINNPKMISPIIRKNRSKYSKEELVYINSFNINKNYYNLYVWLKCQKDLVQLYKNDKDLDILIKIHRKVVLASFLSWIFNSRSKGLFYVSKLVFDSLRGIDEAKHILKFLIQSSFSKIISFIK